MAEIITIGRIVHYVMPVSFQHRPAIVVHVESIQGIEDSVELLVFTSWEDQTPDYLSRQGHVPFDERGERPHSWHWPERAGGMQPAAPR